ncbi:MAG: phosphonate C-P lyase system protein PhnH [Pseudomonadota bacterium]
MTSISQSIVEGGLADPVHDAQRVFDGVMRALSRPGQICPIDTFAKAPQPLNSTTAALLQTLADADTNIWLDAACNGSDVRGWVSFHTGSPVVEATSEAHFAIVADPSKVPSLMMFALGTQEYPDRSTTIIVQVPAIGTGSRWRLSGPGIKDTGMVQVEGMPADFEARWAENRGFFPRGVDLVLAAPDAVLGLPRTTKLEAMENA